MTYKRWQPGINKKCFAKAGTVTEKNAMTLEGVAKKCLALLALCIAFGAYGWYVVPSFTDATLIIFFGSIIVAFIIALITIFKPKTSPYLAPAYAILEGFILGVISRIYNEQYQGIVVQAVLLTASIFVAMLLIYLLKIIKPTQNIKMGVAAATFGALNLLRSMSSYWLVH
jgi:uncharacterized YccA/Bax inhibitor family protein